MCRSVTPAARKSAWRNIERKYLPHRNYEGNEYLERGGYWQRQLPSLAESRIG
jgi:hypothetical protein